MRRALRILAFLLLAALVVGCGRGNYASSVDGIDSEFASWTPGIVLSTKGSSLVSWVETSSDRHGMLTLLTPDRQTKSLGPINAPELAVSPDGATFVASDYILAEAPSTIDAIESTTGTRSSVLEGRLLDRSFRRLMFINESEFIWLREDDDGDPDDSRQVIVRNSLNGAASRAIATFKTIDWFDLSPDRSQLAIAGASNGSSRHDLWTLNLSDHSLSRVSEGVDVQFARWLTPDSGIFAAKDSAQKANEGWGPLDADAFFDQRHMRPGRLYRWEGTRTEAMNIKWSGGGQPGELVISPDGRTLAVFVWRRADPKPTSSLAIIDLPTGRIRREIHRRAATGNGEIALFSPDSASLAFRVGKQIRVLRMKDFHEVALHPLDTWGALTHPNQAAWEADGSLMFFSTMDAPGISPSTQRVRLFRWGSDGQTEWVTDRPELERRDFETLDSENGGAIDG